MGLLGKLFRVKKPEVGPDGKVECKKCGARMMPITAEINKGLCPPCFEGKRPEYNQKGPASNHAMSYSPKRTESNSKRCGICDALVDKNALQCQACGWGVFQTTQKRVSEEDDHKFGAANSDAQVAYDDAIYDLIHRNEGKVRWKKGKENPSTTTASVIPGKKIEFSCPVCQTSIGSHNPHFDPILGGDFFCPSCGSISHVPAAFFTKPNPAGLKITAGVLVPISEFSAWYYAHPIFRALSKAQVKVLAFMSITVSGLIVRNATIDIKALRLRGFLLRNHPKNMAVGFLIWLVARNLQTI